MVSNIMTQISKRIYYIHSALYFLSAILTKFFLVDTDMGARFNGFNHELLTSTLLFFGALVFLLIGLLFNLIKRHRHSNLTDRTLFYSGLLIAPLSLLFVLTPLLMVISPGEVGASTSSAIGFLVGIGTMIWLILVPILVIGQVLRILTHRLKQ